MADSSSYNLSDVESEEPEEFRWEDAGTGTSFAESSTQVLDLMRRGNRAFRDQRFEEAISCYSKAQILKPGDPVILSNRSAAFCRISQILRERSATASEYQPLNGLDPMTHAELALKDADKVIKIGSDTPKPYILKAKALILGYNGFIFLQGGQVRRIMEGNHRMGMVIIDSSTGTIADFACEAEILECEPLPDGRFYLEVEGRRRFQILRSWDQDGYRVAEVEWIQDVPPLEGSQEREELQKMASEAAELAQRWIRNASESARTGRRARRLELLQSGVPGALDPEKLSFWLVNLLNLRPSERLNLLRLRDTRERISSGLDLMRKEEQGCLVQ
ncbi:hypothetical protein HPP92_021256 [Vanilla planifolia]|uniref:Lon N-terminal domain-containing protein n=1 Tax=Vanilla planifolia TaxID=51239 RepID=A0A835UFC7_VANPL|nr:hypothetical protein HPP92_021256 [Vanilla planifolia]